MDEERLKYEWPKEAVLQMINMWQKFEHLYNPKHKSYYNKRIRNTTLNDIADNLKNFNHKIGPNDVKTKMTYLRGQYTREIAKMSERNNDDDTEHAYIPSVYWFDELSFLEEFIKTRKSTSNFQDSIPVINEDPWESPQPADPELSPKPKITRYLNDTPTSSSTVSHEESVLSAATSVLKSIASYSKKSAFNEKDEAFCNYIKAELADIANENIKDELIEKITIAIFNAKKQQRMFNSSLENNMFIKFEKN